MFPTIILFWSCRMKKVSYSFLDNNFSFTQEKIKDVIVSLGCRKYSRVENIQRKNYLRKFIFRIRFFIIVHCVLYFRYDYDGIFEATPGCRRAVRTAIEAAEKNGIKVIPFRPFGLREAFKLNSSYRRASIYNVIFLLLLANMGT